MHEEGHFTLAGRNLSVSVVAMLIAAYLMPILAVFLVGALIRDAVVLS